MSSAPVPAEAVTAKVTRRRSNHRAAFPEIDAGGYSRRDGAVDFYSRIAALVRPDMRVLDFGAGRGHLLSKDGPYRSRLMTLHGRVAHIIGIDVDDAVHDNPYMDEKHVIAPGATLPLADASVDLIYSDWVLEHVATPHEFAAEVLRVLKPGGWFCARTPNRWGMTALAASLVPNRLHSKVLGRLQPQRDAVDVFPTVYKLNTIGQLKGAFKPEQWEHHTYRHSPEPSYLLNSRVALALGLAYPR